MNDLSLLLQGLRRILLQGYCTDASIGVYEHEKVRRQPIRIDVDVWVAGAVTADRLDATLDYDYLRRGISDLLAARHFHLQETLVEEVLALALQPEAVRVARVRTAKTDVYPDCESVGMEMARAKDDLTSFPAGGTS